jgi:hypothetical protein
MRDDWPLQHRATLCARFAQTGGGVNVYLN